MNVGDLMRERDRLLAVIEEAKGAKFKLKQINVLITMYGDKDNVELVSGPLVHCDKCNLDFKGKQGMGIHNRMVHGIAPPPRKKPGPATRAKNKAAEAGGK